MADTAWTGLPASTTADAADIFSFVDISEADPDLKNRKITKANLITTLGVPNAVVDVFAATLSQTIFTASSTPINNDTFSAYRNGQRITEGPDYTLVGTTFTWQDPGGDTLLAGEEIVFQYNNVGGGAVTPPPSVLTFGANSISATTTTRYLYPSFANATAQTSIINMVMPANGTLRNLYIYHNGTAGNGNNIVYTVLKNSVATSLTITIPSTTQTASDTVNTVAIVAGDVVTIEITKAASIGSSPSDVYATLEVI